MTGLPPAPARATLGSVPAGGLFPGRRVVTVSRASLIVQRRAVAVLAGLSVALLALFVLSLSLGTFALPMGDVLRALSGTGSPEAEFIVHTLRLPRAVVATLVGAAFGVSGALLQRLTRNVLASPDIIGITAGASAGAVLLIVLGGSGALAVSSGALGGGLAAAAGVYVLAWRGGLTGYRLVLIGIAITAVLMSGVHYLLTRANITDVAQAQVWLTGSLNAAAWDQAVMVGASLILLVPVAAACRRGLSIVQLGDEAAAALGVPVHRLRGGLVLVAVWLAAMATAAAGPVAFVALSAPPLAQRLLRATAAGLLPAAAMGSVIMLTADMVAQHLLGGLAVGVATALVGAPYLLLLLARANRIGIQ